MQVTHLQAECAADVRHRQRDGHTGNVGLFQPLRQQLQGQQLLQPMQIVYMERQEEHQTGLTCPKRCLQNLNHVLNVFMKTVQT